MFYGFVARARLELGYWPAPYRPDPKELGHDVHMLLSYVLFTCALAAPLLSYFAKRLYRRAGGAGVFVAMLCYVALAGFIVISPSRMLTLYGFLVFAIAGSLLALFLHRRDEVSFQVRLSFLVWLLTIGIAVLDPGQFIVWFLD